MQRLLCNAWFSSLRIKKKKCFLRRGLLKLQWVSEVPGGLPVITNYWVSPPPTLPVLIVGSELGQRICISQGTPGDAHAADQGQYFDKLKDNKVQNKFTGLNIINPF